MNNSTDVKKKKADQCGFNIHTFLCLETLDFAIGDFGNTLDHTGRLKSHYQFQKLEESY